MYCAFIIIIMIIIIIIIIMSGLFAGFKLCLALRLCQVNRIKFKTDFYRVSELFNL